MSTQKQQQQREWEEAFHAGDKEEDEQSRSTAPLFSNSIPTSNPMTEVQHDRRQRAHTQDPLHRFYYIPTFQLNNYLLALARAYRSPPAAYVYEAIRLLRDILYTRHYYRPPSRVESPEKRHIGPDRMTFEIILDMLARAIPLHTDLSRKLSEDKREEIRSAKKAAAEAAGAAGQQPGSSAEPVIIQYGSSKRVRPFVDVYTPDAPFGSTRSAEQRPRLGPKLHPSFVLNSLQQFLNRAQAAMLPEQMHYFAQAERHLESASDAGDIFFHPGPTRIGRAYLAKLAANKEAEAAAVAAASTAKQKGKEQELEADHVAPHNRGVGGEAAQALAVPAVLPAPKTPAQTYLSLFALIYSTMIDRYPDSPHLLRAITPPTASATPSSLESASDPRRARRAREEFQEEQRQWVRDILDHPQFVKTERARSSLTSSGHLGPPGPTVYAYAARILCFHRIREWAEVQATVRECLARSFWIPPVIKPRWRATARESRNNRSERVAPPQGWTVDQIVEELKKANAAEKSMFNMTLLSHTLWAWVRVAAPSAPYTSHVEEWEQEQQARQEAADDEPAPLREEGDVPESENKEEPDESADIALPPPSPLLEEAKPDTTRAVKSTVKALRDVYDLLRDNAILQEWERIEALSTPRQVPPAPLASEHGSDSWLSLEEPDELPSADGAQRRQMRSDRTHPNASEAALSAQFASLARRATTNGWSRDKLWLAQMRALLLHEQRWTSRQRVPKKKADIKGHDGAVTDAQQKRTHSPAKDPVVMEDVIRKKDVGEDVERSPTGTAKPSRIGDSPYSGTLRTIFGIPTHPAISPPLPPHIIPDEILYSEFIRLFTHLGDWNQAIEVLADYEQTTLPSLVNSAVADDAVGSDSAGPGSLHQSSGQDEGRLRQREWFHLGPNGGTNLSGLANGGSDNASYRSQVVNEMTLHMFDAFFRGFAQHGVQPLPMTDANVHAHLERAQQRVQRALQQMDWTQTEDGSGNGGGAGGVPPTVELLDVSRFFGMIHPSERGWSLESLLFLLEAFKRVRPDCGADSVRRRAQAREAAYLRQWNERRRAHWDPKREGAFDRGLMQGEPYKDADLPLHSFGYEEGASPTPLNPAGRPFFDHNVGPEARSLGGFAHADPTLDLWSPEQQSKAEPEQFSWTGPVGRSLFGQLFGPDQDLTSSLNQNLPARIFGKRSNANTSSSDSTDFLEVDDRGKVRGFHRAPVPRQLFWVLTALRRVTGDRAPTWVLDQWSLLLQKFGPDSDKHDQLWAEEQARVARWKRRMHSAPGELDEDADRDSGRQGVDDESEYPAKEEERRVTLWGTGRHGSLDLRTGEETDANRQGWHSWKFPQRRTSRVVQYLAMSAGIDDSEVRHG
ncbi:GTPase-activating protein [Tilletia horrida]|nr:GTPase-activating protein [Tilletia horrida]